MRTIPPVFRQSQVAAALALALSPATSMAATIIVDDHVASSGPGTLYDAILQANTNCASDPNPTIAFAFPGTGPFVIKPSSPLPQFFCPTNSMSATIDGFSQTGSSANTLAQGWDADLMVVLDGSGGASTSGCGLNLNSGGVLTVTGLRIQNFSYGGSAAGVCGPMDVRGNEFVYNDYGVYLNDYGYSVGGSGAADRNVFVHNDAGIYSNGGGSVIENNFIGTKDGSTAAGNVKGIYVGGGGWVYNNVISGNSGVGVDVDYGGVTIENNTIGLNAAKTAKLANGGGGILIQYSAYALIEDNFISGNSVAGIMVQGSSFVEISGNTIGLNYGGGVIANARGIDASCGADFTIEDNTVAGNQFDGILLSGIDGSSIERNTIADNKGSGLRIDLGSCYGGNHFVNDNLVTGNTIDGVLVTGGSVQNQITANQIFTNGRKNINLNSSSTPLPNDAGDSDGGSNFQQNYPVLDSVTQNGSQTDVFFTLNTADGDYIVEFFANSAAGKPAGESYLGSKTVTVYGGTATSIFSAYALLDHISATATDTGGNTSELSPQKAATTAPAASLSPSALIFGNVRVGTTSMDRIVTVRSVGDQPYIISSFCYGGPDALTGKLAVAPISALCTGGAFSCESTCVPGQPYNKKQSCSITASFSPGFAGPFSEDLFLCDNSSTGVTTLNLSGTGVPPPPLQISPTFYDFGGIPVGGTSDTALFEVKNVSYGMLSILGVVTTGEYDLVSTTCTGVLYGGGICEAVVTFGPTISGESFGTVTASAGPVGDAKAAAAAGPMIVEATADLVGVGLAGGEMTLPGPIELGAAPVGGAAITRSVELRNTGTQPVNVASITVSAPFTIVSNNCVGTPIPPGGGCAVVIGYAATAPGSVTGSLTIVSDATGGSGEVSVHATGQTIASPFVVATPSSIGFGDRTIGTQTSGRTVSLTNIGGLTANLSLAVSSIDFILGSTSCGATLAPLASCTAEVSFRPILGFGPRTGALVINSNSPNSPLSVILGGTSCRPFVGLGSRTGTSSNCAP